MMVLALFVSHKTDDVVDTLLTDDVWLSSIPGGCTNLVQFLAVSINRPFEIYERFAALRPSTLWLESNIGYSTNPKLIIRKHIKKD